MGMRVITNGKRKGIDIDLATKKALTSMALDADTTLKPFIEAQMVAMGEKGIPYLDLWKECEALRAQLQSLTTKTT